MPDALPATPAELHATAVECAEASVAMYAAREAYRKAADQEWDLLARWERAKDNTAETGIDVPTTAEIREATDATDAAAEREVAQSRRHRAATQAWAAIRPETP